MTQTGTDMVDEVNKAIRTLHLGIGKGAITMELIVERLADVKKCGLTRSEIKVPLSSELVEKTKRKGIKCLLEHTISGNKGELVEIKDHSSRGKIYIIQLRDGRQYFAPANEFRVIDKN